MHPANYVPLCFVPHPLFTKFLNLILKPFSLIETQVRSPFSDLCLEPPIIVVTQQLDSVPGHPPIIESLNDLIGGALTSLPLYSSSHGSIIYTAHHV